MPPYLSIVVTSRNDNHGGNPLRRTQIGIDSLAFQAKKHALPLEYIMVEWNPPQGVPLLSEALRFPVNEYFYARVIVVPREIHAGFRYGDRMPLFQMIAKNAGIRRAEGEFVLATNIDVLLDDALFERLAKRDLNPKRMYRADRYDVETSIPDSGYEEQQEFCRDTCHHVRRNYRGSPWQFRKLQNRTPYDSSALLAKKKKFPWASFGPDSVTVTAKDFIHVCNGNACGDFTLLHKKAWEAIRGYPEFEASSMDIDSFGSVQAHCAGFLEETFLPPKVCYHIEHGEGFQPEHVNLLTTPLFKQGIPYLDLLYPEIMNMISAQHGILFNDETWGLHGFILDEHIFTSQGYSLRKGEACIYAASFYFRRYTSILCRNIISEQHDKAAFVRSR